MLQALAALSTNGDLTDSERTEVLLYAFKVWQSAGKPEPLTSLKELRVPTIGGWYPAKDAVFGDGWNADSKAADLDKFSIDNILVRFINAASKVSDLDGFVDRLIKAPQEWVPEMEEVGEVLEFLELAGVKHGIQTVNALRGPLQIKGADFRRNSPWESDFQPLEHLGEKLFNTWWENRWPEHEGHPVRTRDYRLQQFHMLPGQGQWQAFPEAAKNDYAFLVAHWLSKQGDYSGNQNPFIAVFRKDSGQYPLEIDVSSLARVFLTTVPWFPVSKNNGDQKWSLLRDAWWSNERRTYVDAPTPEICTRAGQTGKKVLITLGLQNWDDPGSASERLDTIATALTQIGWTGQLQSDHDEAWEDFLQLATERHYSPRLVQRVLIRESEDIRTLGLSAAENDVVVYYPVPENPNSLLLDQLPDARITIGKWELAEQVGVYLQDKYPRLFRSVADAEIAVAPDRPQQRHLLGEILHVALEVLLISLMQKTESTRVSTLEERGDFLRGLRRIPVIISSDFDVMLDGNHVKIPDTQSSISTVDPAGDHILYLRMARTPQEAPNIWDILDGIAEGLSYALEAPPLKEQLRSAVSDLQRLSRDSESVRPEGIPIKHLVATLRKSEAEIEQLWDEIDLLDGKVDAPEPTASTKSAQTYSDSPEVPPISLNVPANLSALGTENTDSTRSDADSGRESSPRARSGISALTNNEHPARPEGTQPDDLTPEEVTEIMNSVDQAASHFDWRGRQAAAARAPEDKGSTSSPKVGSGGGWGASGRTRDSQDPHCVGILGELWAGKWIEQEYGVPLEQAWRSGYRNKVPDGVQGSDRLGYDFEISIGRQTLYLEVKATAGTETSFILTANEVRRASSVSDLEDYKILFITNVLDSDKLTYYLLENPLGEGRAHVTLESQEITFSFTPDDSGADSDDGE